MGVEQDGLGLRVIQRVVYEIEPPAAAGAAGSIAERNARRPQIGRGALAGRRQAILRRFIATELYGCARDRRAGRQHIGRRRVDEHQHRAHERGQGARGGGGGGERGGGGGEGQGGGAGGVQPQADGVDAGRHGGIQVFFARQATDFDAGAGRRSQRSCRVFHGQPSK